MKKCEVTCRNEICKLRRMNSFYNKEINHKIASKNKQAYKQTNKRTKHRPFEIVFATKRICFDFFLTLYVVLAYRASSEILSRDLLLSDQTYHMIQRLSFYKNTHHLHNA